MKSEPVSFFSTLDDGRGADGISNSHPNQALEISCLERCLVDIIPASDGILLQLPIISIANLASCSSLLWKLIYSHTRLWSHFNLRAFTPFTLTNHPDIEAFLPVDHMGPQPNSAKVMHWLINGSVCPDSHPQIKVTEWKVDVREPQSMPEVAAVVLNRLSGGRLVYPKLLCIDNTWLLNHGVQRSLLRFLTAGSVEVLQVNLVERNDIAAGHFVDMEFAPRQGSVKSIVERVMIDSFFLPLTYLLQEVTRRCETVHRLRDIEVGCAKLPTDRSLMLSSVCWNWSRTSPSTFCIQGGGRIRIASLMVQRSQCSTQCCHV